MIGQNIPAASQLQFLALAVNKMPGHGTSNEMPPQLQPKKAKVRLY